jgi:putative photosynthetic complex assembly protein
MTTTTIETQRFPRGALVAAAALIIFSLGVASFTRLTGIGATHVAAPMATETRSLRFLDMPGGAVEIRDSATGALVHTVVPGEDGFVRVLMRSLARERRLRDIGNEPPFNLIRSPSGQLTIEDPATGRIVPLIAFGADNAAAFAPMMPARSTR